MVNERMYTEENGLVRLKFLMSASKSLTRFCIAFASFYCFFPRAQAFFSMLGMLLMPQTPMPVFSRPKATPAEPIPISKALPHCNPNSL